MDAQINPVLPGLGAFFCGLIHFAQLTLHGIWWSAAMRKDYSCPYLKKKDFTPGPAQVLSWKITENESVSPGRLNG